MDERENEFDLNSGSFDLIQSFVWLSLSCVCVSFILCLSALQIESERNTAHNKQLIAEYDCHTNVSLKEKKRAKEFYGCSCEWFFI